MYGRARGMYRASLTRAFHREYYDAGARGGTWRQTRWFGIDTWKCPLDMWVIQELIVSVRPDLIVEVGTYRGGGTLFYAHICDLLDHGKVMTIDVVEQPARPGHGRITYVAGSSLDADVIDAVADRARRADRVMVLLDGDHTKDHVLRELRTYAAFVTPGSYLIAEDTNVNGRPAFRRHGPGPGEAVDAFLAETSDFEADTSCEKFLLTFNPSGFLRRRPR